MNSINQPQTGMQLYDAEGRRLYFTEEERRAFVAAAAHDECLHTWDLTPETFDKAFHSRDIMPHTASLILPPASQLEVGEAAMARSQHRIQE